MQYHRGRTNVSCHRQKAVGWKPGARDLYTPASNMLDIINNSIPVKSVIC